MIKKRRYYSIMGVSGICILVMLAMILAKVYGIGISKATTETAVRTVGSYGVFLGVDEETYTNMVAVGVDPFADYTTIVIDATEYSEETIATLHEQGHVLYSYLNVGSLETYRDYYEEFQDAVLDPYENWPDEYWMDVSDSAWQSLVGGTIPAALVEKGVDGFFIDNTDVYYQYPDTRIYQGLKTILYGIAKYEMPVIINGGDTFVTAMIGKGETLPFTGVNQEGVFTTIEDYETDTFSTQTEEDRKYFQTYLKHCKEAGLDVYLLEYTVDTELMQEIADYAQEKGYSMYISATVGLDET